MSIIFRRHRSLSHIHGNESNEHHKPVIRSIKTHGRLRMLVEQSSDGRKRLHLKGRILSMATLIEICSS
jgi:hypothetical protein